MLKDSQIPAREKADIMAIINPMNIDSHLNLIDSMSHLECQFCLHPISRFDIRRDHYLYECPAIPNELRQRLLDKILQEGGQ